MPERKSRIILLLCVAAVLTAILFSSCSRTQHQGPIIWDMSEVEAIRGDSAFFVMADRFAAAEPVSVIRKPRCLSGDVHNYESLASYRHPVPGQPDAEYEYVDGVFNPECDIFNRTQLFDLGRNLQVLSKAYALSGEKRYADAAVKQLDTWFLDRDTYMYPNFEHSQIIINKPGNTRNYGEPGGIIDVLIFGDVLESIRLLDSCRAIPCRTMKGLKAWFSAFEDWMVESDWGLKEGLAVNNHSLAMDVCVLNFARFTGNEDHAKWVMDGFTEKRLLHQIQPDGTQPQELARTRPIHYSIYNLEHIVDYCFILQSMGIPYYNEHRELIDAAFKVLTPYVGHLEDFPLRDIGDLAADDLRIRKNVCRLQRLGCDAFDFDALRPEKPQSWAGESDPVLVWEFRMLDYDDAITAPTREQRRTEIRRCYKY